MSNIPSLRYKEHELEPVLSRHEVDVHYNKHTKKYYDTAFKLLKDTAYEGVEFETLLKTDKVKQGSILYDNVSQAWNHTFYWNSLTTEPSNIDGAIEELAQETFGSVDKFKSSFIEAATKHFASGWAWVSLQNDKLTIHTTPDATNPLNEKNTFPLFVVDLWEHAYLYDDRYAADRRKYLTQIWTIVDWEEVNDRLEHVSRGNA